MKSNTEAALAFILKDEGGYAERKEEGGGAVNKGVTFTVFKAWREGKGLPSPTWSDLKVMPVEEAKSIYLEQFFAGVYFDELPPGIDYAVIDAAITGGVAGSIKILQGVLGLKQDGHFGLVTRWAVNHRPIFETIDKLTHARHEKYKTFTIYNKVANPDAVKAKQKTWGQIWTARIVLVNTRAKSLVTADAFIPPETKTALIVPTALAFPPAIIKMPASNFLSAGMIKRGGTPEQFLNYLRDEVAPRMGAWRPRGVVLHNTGALSWGKTTPQQRLDNMTPYWISRKFKSTPHIFVAPDGMIWIGWPLWKPGTHAPSWNNTHWGVETVGDWNKQTPTKDCIRACEIASAGMLAMLGHMADNETIKFHKEDPKTGHKKCPGPNFGTKPSWVKAIAATMVSLNSKS